MFESMPVLAGTIFFLIIISLGALYASFLFTFYPQLYSELDGILSIDFGVETTVISVLEGKINLIDDWLLENRKIFGPAFLVLLLHNLIKLISFII